MEKIKTVSSNYLQIALDLASRIAKGDFSEGERISGRSLIASEYNVSPETIRRSLRLLANMKVVEIRPQSGTVVLSVDSARRYISNFQETQGSQNLREELNTLLKQYEELDKKLKDTVEALVNRQSAYSSADAPFPNYEVQVEADSPLIKKSIGELKFWQSTGATIVGIRRGGKVILSPGPYLELYCGDVIILVGTLEAASAASRFVKKKEENKNDSI